MVWFKVDDVFAFHRKAVAAGNAALGLWVRAGAWCGMNLSDGRIPADIVRAMGTTAQAARLVKAGLWVEGDGEYIFHDWQQCNPLASSVRQTQKRSAANQQAYRDRQKIKEIFSEDHENNFRTFEKTPRSDSVVSDNEPMAVVGSGSRVPTGSPVVTLTDMQASQPALFATSHTDRGDKPGSGPPQWRPCASLTKQGAPCRNLAAPGLPTCTFHDPGRVARSNLEDPQFAGFWAAYPRKVARPKALEMWTRAVTAKHHDPVLIIAAARAYAADPGRKPDYTAHPATWLNQERYNDKPPERDTGW
jgi:hypothetical protein